MAAQAPFGTDLQPQFEVKVRGGKVLHVVKQPERASPKAYGTSDPRTAASHVRSDAHRSPTVRPVLERRDEAEEERERPNLPDIVDHEAAGIASGGSQERARSRRRWREVTISDATARQQAKDALSILEPCMRSARPPRARTLDSIQRLCSQLDSRHARALENAAIARAFQTCGVRVSDEDVGRLSRLTGSAGEGDITHYHCLCGALKKLLSESEGESQSRRKCGTKPLHPSSSHSAASSSAARQKALLLSDAGTANTASGGEKGESRGREEWPPLHPHRRWPSPGRGEHSHSVNSSEQEHATTTAGWTSHWEGEMELLQAVGFECLKRALQSCSSDEGRSSMAPFRPLLLLPSSSPHPLTLPLPHFLLLRSNRE